MGDLTFEGWRREAAKRPIETKEQREAWLWLCERSKLTSGALASMCAVSRQTASGWRNKPESTLSWKRFEQVARLTLERDISEILAAGDRHDKARQYAISRAASEMQRSVDLITGRNDDERAAREELGATLNELMQIYAALDEDRRIALERVALDMLTAQHAEREREQN